MKSMWMSFAVAGVLLVCSSGCLFVHLRMPLDRDLQRTELGDKEGWAHSRSALWLFAWGDSGTHAAAADGNIKVINHADMEIRSYLFGAYTRLSTIVYGD